MPQTVFYEIEKPFCCSRKTKAGAEQKPYVADFHYHDAYEIFLFLGGKASMYYEGEYHPMNPGELYIFPPSVPHGAACFDAKVYDRLVINIREEFLQELSTEETDLSAYLLQSEEKETSAVRVLTLDNKGQKRLIQLVEENVEFEAQVSGYGKDLEARARAIILLVTINRFVAEYKEQKKKMVHPALIEDIIDYVTEHLTEQITLKDLSVSLFLSSKYLSSVFHKKMGMTLREYIISKRIDLAKKLLSEGKSVSQACEQSGFSDYANFIRTFTKTTGISPGRFARGQMDIIIRN